MGFGHFFSNGICRFFVLVHFVSGFQIFRFINFARSFQFSFCRWSKFWLIVACDYSAYFLVKSLWRRFFFSGNVQFWQSQVSKIGFISLVKGFGKFCSGWLVKFHSLAKVFFNWQSFCFASVLVSRAFFGNCQKLSCV